MIRSIKIELNAAFPNMPLLPFQVFHGSAAAVTVLNVPRRIESLSVKVKNVSAAEQSFPAERTGSAWVATIPGSFFEQSGTSTRGVKVEGADASGNVYVLGSADLVVMLDDGTVTPVTPQVIDDTVTEDSPRPVKSSGIWSWVKGLLSPITTAISSLTSSVSGLESSKLDKSAKLSDLHDEAGTPTSDNRLELLGTGKLQSKTKVQTGWGTIRLDNLSDGFTAYDNNGEPYSSIPPLGEWKGPFGPFSIGYTYYVPASEPDPTSDDEALAGKWCLYNNNSQWYLLCSQSAYAAIPSIEAAEFTNDSADSPAPYAIVGHAYFTREPVTETQTRQFAETTDIIKQSQVTEQTPDGKAADAKDLKAQLAGKLDLSGGEMTMQIAGGLKLKFFGGTEGEKDGIMFVDENDHAVAGLGVALGSLCVFGVGFYLDGTTGLELGDTVYSKGFIQRQGSNIVIPLKSGTIALLSDILARIAPAYSATSAYAIGAKVVYNGALYTCKTAIPTGGEAWNAAHWDALADLSGVLSGLKSDGTATDQFATSLMEKQVAINALHYALYSVPTTGEDANKLKDRAVNAFEFSGSLHAFPAQITGHARDFLMNVTATATASDIALPETGATSVGDALAFTSGKTYLVAITEIEVKKYYIRVIDTTPANAA